MINPAYVAQATPTPPTASQGKPQNPSAPSTGTDHPFTSNSDMQLLDKALANFAQYDKNNDGYIDFTTELGDFAASLGEGGSIFADEKNQHGFMFLSLDRDAQAWNGYSKEDFIQMRERLISYKRTAGENFSLVDLGQHFKRLHNLNRQNVHQPEARFDPKPYATTDEAMAAFVTQMRGTFGPGGAHELPDRNRLERIEPGNTTA